MYISVISWGTQSPHELLIIDVCEAPSNVLNVNNEKKEGVTVTSFPPDAVATAFEGSSQQYSTNNTQVQVMMIIFFSVGSIQIRPVFLITK